MSSKDSRLLNEGTQIVFSPKSPGDPQLFSASLNPHHHSQSTLFARRSVLDFDLDVASLIHHNLARGSFVIIDLQSYPFTKALDSQRLVFSSQLPGSAVTHPAFHRSALFIHVSFSLQLWLRIFVEPLHEILKLEDCSADHLVFHCVSGNAYTPHLLLQVLFSFRCLQIDRKRGALCSMSTEEAPPS